mgnify:CR=1 FL=1
MLRQLFLFHLLGQKVPALWDKVPMKKYCWHIYILVWWSSRNIDTSQTEEGSLNFPRSKPEPVDSWQKTLRHIVYCKHGLKRQRHDMYRTVDSPPRMAWDSLKKVLRGCVWEQKGWPLDPLLSSGPVSRGHKNPKIHWLIIMFLLNYKWH